MTSAAPRLTFPAMTSPEDELRALAEAVVDRARASFADVAEAKAYAGWELTVRIRLGEPELVQEAVSAVVSVFSKPVFAKLTPNVANIVKIGEADAE